MYPSLEGTHNRNNELKLDPGTPARRNRSSGCKCILTIILVTIGLGVAVFAGLFFVSFFRLVRQPHADLLYKINSVDLADPAAVVRPLIDEKQTFDIVATVWLRTNDSNSGSDGLDRASLPNERVIFTGTVFQALTVKDKEKRATIEYKVPTEIFKNRDLIHYDLRASFVLIPTSPSLLDNLVNYSSWRNEKILFPPFRFWPDTGPAPTLQDKAIDSFGTSIGLVNFLSIHSRCGVTAPVGTSNTSNASEHSLFEVHTSDEDSEDEVDEDTANVSKYGRHHIPAYSSSKGQPVLESHPYIISRSDLLVVELTALYDRKLYNRAHTKLKANACGLVFSPPNYDWRLCNRHTFRNHGNMGTRLQLKMEEGENVNKHWAYAPYLALTQSAWTPKDLVPVPVNREDCTKGGRFKASKPLLQDEEFVDISWKITYSGRTPTKLMFSEALSAVRPHNMTDTDVNRQKAQLNSETILGFRGHRLSEDRHPRRMIFVGLMLSIIKVVTTLLNMHYWYTRSSTIGISKIAILLVVVSTLGKYFLIIFFPEKGFLVTLAAMIPLLPFQIMPFLMMKVVWRIELGWGKNNGKENGSEKESAKGRRRKCLPSLNFVKATHRERASARLDESLPWTVKLSLFISCCLAYSFLSPTTSFLIPPLGLPTPKVDEFWLRDTLLYSVFFPAFTVGSGLQLWFNHQSHTFAGKYKLSAISKGISVALEMLGFSTRVLGNRDVRNGFSVNNFVDLIIVVVWCWQAVTLPKVPQGEVDDETE